jgi:hypothetical protein
MDSNVLRRRNTGKDTSPLLEDEVRESSDGWSVESSAYKGASDDYDDENESLIHGDEPKRNVATAHNAPQADFFSVIWRAISDFFTNVSKALQLKQPQLTAPPSYVRQF